MGYDISAFTFYGIRLDNTNLTWEDYEKLPVYIKGFEDGDKFFGISLIGRNAPYIPYLIASPTQTSILGYYQHADKDCLSLAELRVKYVPEAYKFQHEVLLIAQKYNLTLYETDMPGVSMYDIGWHIGVYGS